MSLTGTPFLLLLIVALVLFTVAAIGELPFLRWPRLVKRIVFVVGAQFSAVMLALVLLNNWGEFYGSWSDLFGGGSSQVTTVTAGSGGAKTNGVPSSLVLTKWSSRKDLPKRGGVFAMTLRGSKTHLATNALVYLPPQYFQSENAHHNFPVVEVFAGYPGDVPELVDRLGYPSALDKAMKDGGVKPMIMVMMRPTVVPPRDTECTNVPGGPQVFTFFAQEVPEVIKSNLRVTPSGWGAMGHSTGGYCAAKMAMAAPSQFKTAVSLSGYFTPKEDQTTGNLYGGSEEQRHENDLVWRVKNKPVPDVSILASIGSDELGAEGISNNKLFVSSAKPPLRVQLKTVVGGGHNFGTYQRVLPDAFAWLSENMTQS